MRSVADVCVVACSLILSTFAYAYRSYEVPSKGFDVKVMMQRLCRPDDVFLYNKTDPTRVKPVTTLWYPEPRDYQESENRRAMLEMNLQRSYEQHNRLQKILENAEGKTKKLRALYDSVKPAAESAVRYRDRFYFFVVLLGAGFVAAVVYCLRILHDRKKLCTSLAAYRIETARLQQELQEQRGRFERALDACVTDTAMKRNARSFISKERTQKARVSSAARDVEQYRLQSSARHGLRLPSLTKVLQFIPRRSASQKQH